MHEDRFVPARIAWRWLLALAALRLLLHIAVNDQYGFHRDELQLWADAQRLDWGYVPYPPLTALLGRTGIELLGDSTSGLRLFAALAQAVTMVAAGLIARELGGRRMAQTGAALAVACAPVSMLQGSMLMYVGIEYLWVVLAVWMVLRATNDGDPRWWLGVGLAIGLGMMTRYTMLIWAVGVAAGVVFTPLRRQLASPWLWAGVALSLLVFAPNAWWQWRHDFVYFDFVEHIHARDVRIGRTEGFLTGQLLIGANPIIAPLWLGGLAWLILSKAAARWRVLAWMYGSALLLFWLAQARDYYMAPGYPMLLAAGAVALEAGIARLRAAAAHRACAALVLVSLATFATTALVALPVAPVNSTAWRISRSFHDNFAEQIGWPELVAQVAQVYHALPARERARTAIFANNYGEAGAIDRYGPAHGLPPAIATVNGYWYRGYGAIAPRTVIVLGDDAEGISDTPATCTLAGRVRIPHGVENEESGHPDIFICRDFRVPIHTLWPPGPSFG